MKYLPSDIVVTRFVYIRATAEIIISQFSTIFVPSKIPKISYLFFTFYGSAIFKFTRLQLVARVTKIIFLLSTWILRGNFQIASFRRHSVSLRCRCNFKIFDATV